MTTNNTVNKNYLQIDRLNAWLEEITFTDDFDLTLYMEYAGRMASLGDNSAIENIDKVFSLPQYVDRIDDIVEMRVKDGLWDLDEQLEEDLALSIIEAQDFYSFVRHCGDKLSDKSKARIEEWANYASKQSLDDEAVQFLENWVREYRIDEDDQLAPIAAPLSEVQLNMIDRVLSEIKQVTVLNAEQRDGEWSCETPRGTIRKGVAPNGELYVDFPAGYHVQRVSVGAIPATRSFDHINRWKLMVPYSVFSEKNKAYLRGNAPVVFYDTPIKKTVCK